MSRLRRFRDSFTGLDVDGMLIVNPENRRYLSNFSGSSGVLLVNPESAHIVTDFRYWEQVSVEVAEFELFKQGPDLWKSIVELIGALKWKRIGFEPESLTFKEYQNLLSVSSGGLELIPVSEGVENLRRAKEPDEVKLLAEAAKITDLAWHKTLALIKPGVKESEIGLEFDYQLRLNGAEGCAFTTIIASGARGALPHGHATDKTVNPGDLIVMDGGALFKGYHADMTRTVVLGKATPEQRKVYKIVLEAQEKALAALKAGVIGKDIDAIARDHIRDKGYGQYFGHGLGHSVGLQIHEKPRLAPVEESEIPAGAAITVEPGIYLPEWGGVRIEDLVIVEDSGVKNLTGSPKKELMEL